MGFTFVDLCSGIGGFHVGCAAQHGKCIDAAEIDPYAREIYHKSFGIVPQHDVTHMKLPVQHVDLVCFGNPCQSFSTLGNRASFRDARGRVFFSICDYIRKTRPSCFIMENVPNFMWLDHGAHFRVACDVFTRMGYSLSYKILNTLDFGLPQNRARLFIVGHGQNRRFVFPERRLIHKKKRLDGFLDAFRDIKSVSHLLSARFSHHDLSGPPLTVKEKSGFIIKTQINRFTDKRLFSSHGTIGTILSQNAPYIFDEKLGVVRHLSPAELLRCQGFPENTLIFPPDAKRSHFVKYVGNSVCPKMVSFIVSALQEQHML